jgi:flagellar protein FliJ
MSAIDSLIRLYRWQLDERRQQVAELERLEARLNAELRRLDEEIAAEQRAAEASAEGSRAWAGWSPVAAARRQTLETSVAEAKEQMSRAQDALAEAFQEVKRYELAAASREKREQLARARKQQQAQDDVALQVFRRRAG